MGCAQGKNLPHCAISLAQKYFSSPISLAISLPVSFDNLPGDTDDLRGVLCIQNTSTLYNQCIETHKNSPKQGTRALLLNERNLSRMMDSYSQEDKYSVNTGPSPQCTNCRTQTPNYPDPLFLFYFFFEF